MSARDGQVGNVAVGQPHLPEHADRPGGDEFGLGRIDDQLPEAGLPFQKRRPPTPLVHHEPFHQDGIDRYQATGTVKCLLGRDMRMPRTKNMDQAAGGHGVGAPTCGDQ